MCFSEVRPQDWEEVARRKPQGTSGLRFSFLVYQRRAKSPAGNAWAFIEAANFALRFSAEAKRFYERKKARTNNVVATKALAHKLARACFHILKERQAFDAGRCFV